ncbi:MAG: hypothetical protein DRO98_00955 [Archaeoglobales archaeon]|nr:MAG: hypothetical protein DRO98_00955 [Archaeoglobales archaeon]
MYLAQGLRFGKRMSVENMFQQKKLTQQNYENAARSKNLSPALEFLILLDNSQRTTYADSHV